MKAVMNERKAVINERDFDKLKDLVHSPRLHSTHAPTLALLERELERSNLMSPMRVPASVVTMNSRVEFVDLKSGEHDTCTLVFPDAADIEQQRVSVLAPLGTALLGVGVGDVVQCQTPSGLREIRVERILYQPEAAGDYHL